MADRVVTRTLGMRRRVADLLGARDEAVWESLQTLANAALEAARLLEQRLHHGADTGRLAGELREAGEGADEALRQLNRRLHHTFTAPLERDDALALAIAFDRVAQVCAEMGAALDARSAERGRHEARRAASLLSGALERLVVALGDLAAERAAGDSSGEARALLAEGREFVHQGLAEALGAELPADQLLSWKDLYDRLEDALTAARDAERVVDAIELRGSGG
jgi:hypothetical protein